MSGIRNFGLPNRGAPNVVGRGPAGARIVNRVTAGNMTGQQILDVGVTGQNPTTMGVNN